MEVIRTIDELRVVRRRLGDGDLGFVPTMGALHDGHIALLRAARELCSHVVMSIFVNPLQFGEGEDFDAYPRDGERDLRVARAEGVDVTFMPGTDEMYPPGASTRVSVGSLATVLEGAARPGHFDGVCTVVAKLFNLVQPTRAFFGQKDAQQVAVLRKMTTDLDFPIDIVVIATVRERDGLAMSSRNGYLSDADRRRAPTLYRSLQAGEQALRGGEGPGSVERKMIDVLSEQGIEPEYARAVDPSTFEPARDGGPVLLVVAARLGRARLIDNILVAEA